MDIMSVLTASGLGAVVGAAVNGLLARGTARSSSRTEREDEYRREVRSAASAVVRSAHTFVHAAKALEESMCWIQDAVRVTPDRNDKYLACEAAKAELAEKIVDFQLLVDADELPDAAFRVQARATVTHFSMVVANNRLRVAEIHRSST
ncbi:MAG: hypothetical protein M3Y48_14280 [Actinomycetota bacterium]|nr:hypothetical protein [Actinomycetota bacterium]